MHNIFVMFSSHSDIIRPTNQQRRISFISFMYGLLKASSVVSNEVEKIWKEAVGTNILDLPGGRE